MQSRPVNLGNPDEITVRRLAGMIIAACGSRSKITTLPLPPDDPRQRCPDIALAEKAAGLEPETSLDKGLKATIAYFSGDRAT